MPERRYGEREVAEILRAAAEKAAESPETSSSSDGLTLAEIQSMAAEVGIDSRHVAEVVVERASKVRVTGERHFWGAPSKIIREVECSGSLDESSWEDVVTELRNLIGQPGTVSTVGHSREWAGSADLVGLHFRAKPEGDKTRFHLLYNQSGGLVITWLFSFIVTFFVSIAVGSGLAALKVPAPGILLALAATFLGMCAIARLIVARWSAKNERNLNSLVSRASNIVPAPSVAATSSLHQLEEESPVRLSGS